MHELPFGPGLLVSSLFDMLKDLAMHWTGVGMNRPLLFTIENEDELWLRLHTRCKARIIKCIKRH